MKVSFFIALFFLTLPAQLFSQNQKDLKTVVMYLQDNAEILDFAGPIEVFAIAGFEVHTVAQSKSPMRTMNSLTIVPDYQIGDPDIPTPDILAFVGGGHLDHSKGDQVQQWIKHVAETSRIQFSVCTGAFFLAEAGLLKGQIATTFHSAIDLLQRDYPEVDVRAQVRFVDNGHLITTAGISAGIDGALHLVSRIKGLREAKWIAQEMEYDKWIPEEGLVLKNPFLNLVESKGLSEALTKVSEYNFYNGDLLNLSDQFAEQKQYAAAQQCAESALSRMDTPQLKDYDYLKDIYRQQGKAIPPGMDQFMVALQKKGVAGLENLYEKTAEQFPGWLFLDTDQLIRTAYLDFYQADDLATAMSILQFLHRAFPNDAYVTYVLGLYYERSDDLTTAVRLYQQSLEQDPSFFIATMKLQEIQKAGK